MTTVSVPLPDEVFEALRRSSKDLEADVRLAVAVEWYRRGVISQGRAAEVAGIARADFIDALAARRVPVVQLDPEDLERELLDDA